MATSPTSWWSKETVAVVTGGNKGIGTEIVRLLAEHGLTVVLTARDPTKGQATVDGLKEKGLNSVVFHTLDTRSSESAKNLAAWLRKEFGGIDILVNNAGIGGSTMSLGYEYAKEIVETNYRGTKNVTEVLLPLLRASPAGARIVNVTSRGGLYERLRSDSLKQKFKDERNYSEELLESLVRKFLEDKKEGRIDEEGWVPVIPGKGSSYSESKMFMNVYAALLAKSLSKSQPEGHPIYVVSYCPGITRTDMSAPALEKNPELPPGFPVKTPEEGADTGVWLALLPQEELANKSGKLFAEREEYPFGWENPPL